jgi:hypothetical protein
MRRGLAVAALLAVTGFACGAERQAARAPPASVWRANTRQVVDQLRADVETASIGGTTRAAAAGALADLPSLYALLVAYSDLGGCSAMVGAAEPPRRITVLIEPACAHLQRAAALFSRAAQHDEPTALVRASREIALAQPQLVRASLALRR